MNLKVRLAVLSFLQFAVWGAYLTCMGIYLSKIGMGSHIGSFFAMQGVVSLFMPALMGVFADRWIPAQRLLGYCHLLAGTFMILAGWYGMQHGEQTEFGVLFGLYTLSIAFYMPSLALSNAVAYNALTKAGMDIVKSFPPIRVFGTIGFIVTMWVVDVLDYEQNQNQFMLSGALSILMFLYTFTLPGCPVNKGSGKKSFIDIFGLQAFSLFKQKKMAIFFIFSIFLGVCLQITNGFATPFIDHFSTMPEYADSFGVKYPVVLYSISQISETCCILMIPFFLKRYGIKNVMLIAIFAWFLRFFLLGAGNPGDKVWMFILSMIVYGVAFDFFNISGSLFVDKVTDVTMRSRAQGVFMLMTNGIGATVGSFAAQVIVNAHTATDGTIAWRSCWGLFALYAVIVGVVFNVVFRPKKDEVKI
ncbi:MAG: MFS transporter [Prevotella sp.]|nr:MFS transporter [Prevotella sp.]